MLTSMFYHENHLKRIQCKDKPRLLSCFYHSIFHEFLVTFLNGYFVFKLTVHIIKQLIDINILRLSTANIETLIFFSVGLT